MYDVHQQRLKHAIANPPPYPDGRFDGRGIVICAGGARLFTCAWVLIRILQDTLRCDLPIEVWHLGPRELGAPMVALLEERGVTVVDAEAVRRDHPVRHLGGWELKPYALLHSRFQEVLLIDADNIPVVDPVFLFDTTEYRDTGALFWPDIVRLAAENEIWDICGLTYRGDAAFESGQIVLDKARTWRALNLTMYFNAHSDFYYGPLYGDKDTFYLAWRLLECPHAVAPAAKLSGGTLFHVDFAGRLLFQHRTHPKWNLLGRNQQIDGYRFEDECFHYIEDLRRLWDGRIFHPPERGAAARAVEASLIEQRYFRFELVSYQTDLLELLSGHRVVGRAYAGRVWYVIDGADQPQLVFANGGREKSRLSLDGDGVWRGRQVRDLDLPIELYESEAEAAQELPAGPRFVRSVTGYEDL